MLAHADSTGIVDIHPRAIAEEVGISVERVRAAIAELESEDHDSRSPEENGKRLVLLDKHRDWGWHIVNFLKYRSIRNEDERREQNRLAQERWRSKQSKQSKPESADVSTVSQSKPMQKQKQDAEALNTGTTNVVLVGNELPTGSETMETTYPGEESSGLVFAMQSGVYDMPESKLAAYVAVYRFDVRQELLKAALWLRDNKPRRPRTTTSTKRFLTAWLNRHDEKQKPSQQLGGRIKNDEKLEAELKRAGEIKRKREQELRDGKVPSLPTE